MLEKQKEKKILFPPHYSQTNLTIHNLFFLFFVVVVAGAAGSAKRGCVLLGMRPCIFSVPRSCDCVLVARVVVPVHGTPLHADDPANECYHAYKRDRKLYDR